MGIALGDSGCTGGQHKLQGSLPRHKEDLRFVWTSCSIAAVGCSELGRQDFDFH